MIVKDVDHVTILHKGSIPTAVNKFASRHLISAKSPGIAFSPPVLLELRTPFSALITLAFLPQETLNSCTTT